MTGTRVLLERAEKIDQVRLEDLFARTPLELVEQRSAPGDAPAIDQRRGGTDVFARQGQHLVDASNGVPDVQPEIPQWIQQALGQGGDEGVFGIVAQEYDVHVAVQSERQPAVAPNGN